VRAVLCGRGLTGPAAGTRLPYAADSEEAAKRQALNEWIRTGHAYDGVFDFDAAVLNPEHATTLRPRFDSGDHLHLNAAGYQAVAAAIDLRLLRQR
jgi:lysophospholipase L1-like esterase